MKLWITLLGVAVWDFVIGWTGAVSSVREECRSTNHITQLGPGPNLYFYCTPATIEIKK